MIKALALLLASAAPLAAGTWEALAPQVFPGSCPTAPSCRPG
ncbi:hypothetical protein [Mangrovicoccus ximenensis]|nr:hypothetical protein [Mangrovicoccus ximenensis]